MDYILDARQVVRTYALGKGSACYALKGVSLQIEEGEFACIMGASGSGKSTLLYNVSGMDRADSGSVAFDGHLIESLSEKELARLRLTRMGFVFQQGNLLRNLSIFDNIVVAAYLGSGRGNRPTIDERAGALMEQTGIGHLRDNDIMQVSGGEMQRASICRALINEPAMLFGDEPTGALDSSSANDVMNIFCEINQNGKTVLLVTHDAKVAARASRVLYMSDGKIVGERAQGMYLPEAGDLRERENALIEWLSNMV